MAASVSRLDRLARGPVDSEELRETVLVELTVLEREAQTMYSARQASRSVGEEPRLPSGNHPLFAEQLDGFIDTIADARRLAMAEPPNYLGVGRISGGCVACHRLRE